MWVCDSLGVCGYVPPLILTQPSLTNTQPTCQFDCISCMVTTNAQRKGKKGKKGSVVAEVVRGTYGYAIGIPCSRHAAAGRASFNDGKCLFQ